MKNSISTFILVIGFSVISNAQELVNINTATSVLKWSASNVFSFGGHEGTVQFKEGTLIKTNDKITGGHFSMDMHTIINTDGDYSEDLVNHLKDEDFFHVEKFPTANLVITNVKYHDPSNTPNSDKTFIRIHGDLTIKGITLPIWYEAEINAENTEMTSKFKIDRTRWNINFGAKGLSAAMQDNIISDAIVFEVTLRK
jgi:polyisoprenoid-binding protein YceI